MFDKSYVLIQVFYSYFCLFNLLGLREGGRFSQIHFLSADLSMYLLGCLPYVFNSVLFDLKVNNNYLLCDFFFLPLGIVL